MRVYGLAMGSEWSYVSFFHIGGIRHTEFARVIGMECMKFDVDGMYCIMMLRDYKEEIEWL